MTQPRIAAFARLANGNYAPTRIIEGQATRISRTIHVIDYDEVHDEIITSNPQAGAILVFRGQANGNEAPIRVIQGPKTGLVFPHMVTMDTKNGEIIVSDPGRRGVLIFARDANGDVAPKRELRPNGYWIVGTGVDTERDLLVVATHIQGSAVRASGMMIYNRTDTGSVKPRAIISGPNTGIRAPWQIQIHGGKIFLGVSNHLNQRLYEGLAKRPGSDENTEILSPWRSDSVGFVGMWDINDNGDVPPRAIIKGPVSGLVHNPGLAIDPRHGEIFAADSVRNGFFTFLVPEFFSKQSK